jgi:hypothetical protein
MITRQRQIEMVTKLVEECQDTGFFGRVTITFADGQIKTTSREETLPLWKLEERQAQPEPIN